MGTYEFILIGAIVFIALEFLRDQRYWKRIDNMIDRVMAVTSPEGLRDYHYYDKQYTRDLDNTQKQIDKHLEKMDEPELPKDEIPYEDLEEDWDKSEFEEEIKDRK